MRVPRLSLLAKRRITVSRPRLGCREGTHARRGILSYRANFFQWPHSERDSGNLYWQRGKTRSALLAFAYSLVRPLRSRLNQHHIFAQGKHRIGRKKKSLCAAEALFCQAFVFFLRRSHFLHVSGACVRALITAQQFILSRLGYCGLRGSKYY